MKYLKIKTSKKIESIMQNFYFTRTVNQYLYQIVSRYLKYNQPMLTITQICSRNYGMYNKPIIPVIDSYETRYEYLYEDLWRVLIPADDIQYTNRNYLYLVYFIIKHNMKK